MLEKLAAFEKELQSFASKQKAIQDNISEQQTANKKVALDKNFIIEVSNQYVLLQEQKKAINDDFGSMAVTKELMDRKNAIWKLIQTIEKTQKELEPAIKDQELADEKEAYAKKIESPAPQAPVLAPPVVPVLSPVAQQPNQQEPKAAKQVDIPALTFGPGKRVSFIERHKKLIVRSLIGLGIVLLSAALAAAAAVFAPILISALVTGLVVGASGLVLGGIVVGVAYGIKKLANYVAERRAAAKAADLLFQPLSPTVLTDPNAGKQQTAPAPAPNLAAIIDANAKKSIPAAGQEPVDQKAATIEPSAGLGVPGILQKLNNVNIFGSMAKQSVDAPTVSAGKSQDPLSVGIQTNVAVPKPGLSSLPHDAASILAKHNQSQESGFFQKLNPFSNVRMFGKSNPDKTPVPEFTFTPPRDAAVTAVPSAGNEQPGAGAPQEQPVVEQTVLAM